MKFSEQLFFLTLRGGFIKIVKNFGLKNNVSKVQDGVTTKPFFAILDYFPPLNIFLSLLRISMLGKILLSLLHQNLLLYLS